MLRHKSIDYTSSAVVGVDGVERFLVDLRSPPDVATNPEVKSVALFFGEVCTDLHSGLTLLFFSSPSMLETLCHFSKQLFLF